MPYFLILLFFVPVSAHANSSFVIQLERSAPGLGLEQLALRVDFKSQPPEGLFDLARVVQKMTLVKNTNYFCQSNSVGLFQVDQLSTTQKRTLRKLIRTYRTPRNTKTFAQLSSQANHLDQTLARTADKVKTHRPRLKVNKKSVIAKSKIGQSTIDLLTGLSRSKKAKCEDCIKISKKKKLALRIKDQKKAKIKFPCKKKNQNICLTPLGTIYL